MKDKTPTIEVEAGESSYEVSQRIRKILADALEDTTKAELVDALSMALANIITLELVLHDLLQAWPDMSDAKRKRAIKALAHQMSLSSGSEFIDVPGQLQ